MATRPPSSDIAREFFNSLLVERVRKTAAQLGHFFKYISSQGSILPLPKLITENAKNIKSGIPLVDALLKVSNQCISLSTRLQQVNPPVIDYFLGENKDLKEIGKFVISYEILKSEAIFEKHKRNINRDEKRPGKFNENDCDEFLSSDDWYRFITYKLSSGCTTSSDLLKNNVTFITFNYDVSLSSLLYQSFQSIDKFDQKDIEDFFSDNRFIHVYGSIRDFRSFFADEAKFHLINELDNWNRHRADICEFLDTIYTYSGRIRTIDPDEKISDLTSIDAAQKAISEAECVYILGYGFDVNNNKRLSLKKSLGNRKIIAFTNFGDKNIINKRSGRVIFGDPTIFTSREVFGFSGHSRGAEKSTKTVYAAISEDFESIEEDFEFKNGIIQPFFDEEV